MSATLQVRSTQLDLWYAGAFGAYTQVSASMPSVVTDASAGIFGGKKIDATGGTKALGYMAAANWSSTASFTLLVRIIPTWTGNPSVGQELVAVSDIGKNWFGGIVIGIDTDGTIRLIVRDNDGTLPFNTSSSAPLTFVSGQPTDLWFVCSPTTFKVYQAQNGQVPAQVGSTIAASGTVAARSTQGLGIEVCGTTLFGAVSYYLNECVIWNSVEDPISFGARSDFISTSASQFQGYSQSDPGVGNVKSGTSYVSQGVTLTGTLGPFGSTDPGVGNVRAGTNYNINGSALTGTLGPFGSVDPGVENVLEGVDYSINGVDLTGELEVPGPSVDPGEENVLDGVDYEIDGVNKTGTLLSTDPGESNVSLGVDYVINSVDKTGTREVVTNELSTATLKGQTLSAVLKGN